MIYELIVYHDYIHFGYLRWSFIMITFCSILLNMTSMKHFPTFLQIKVFIRFLDSSYIISLSMAYPYTHLHCFHDPFSHLPQILNIQCHSIRTQFFFSLPTPLPIKTETKLSSEARNQIG